MIRQLVTCVAFSTFFLSTITPACAQVQTAQKVPAEPTANTQLFPRQILKTGIDLSSVELSPNTLQLSNSIGLTPILESIETQKANVERNGSQPSVESVQARQELIDLRQKAALIIQKTNLEIDYTLASINAESQLYSEILATFTNDRDKAVARMNAISFISNGVLWAACEALAIPGYKHSFYAIPSGILGIPAGVVPSIASMYTFKLLNGKKKTSEVEPNMLAKVFDYPVTRENDYPKSVWEFLNQSPADAPKSKTRLGQMVDRWIADSNIPAFTDRTSKKQLDVITASVAQKKGLNIGTLTARKVMMDQLSAEILKMKPMLLEMDMVLLGEKRAIASSRTLPRIETQ